jgi:hypothetical protein
LSVARRQVITALLSALGTAACGAQGPALRSSPKAPSPLALDPLVDLVPAATLQWLVEVRPLEILGSPALAPLFAAVASDDQLETFARRHGGVDLRQAEQVVVSGHGVSTLGLARLAVEPWRVEAAFAARARVVEGRAVDRGVTRFWGTVGDEREQVAVFGRSGVGIERGALGPLQAAVYFAQGRLKRSAPALRAAPLAPAATTVGEAPIRGFAPGPFVGDWGAGLGGLLGAATALAVSLRAHQNEPHAATAQAPSELPFLALRVVLTGAWGDDAPAAAERLSAAFQVLAEDPLGRLMGIDHPASDPVTSGAPDALALDVTLDPVRMGKGVRAAMSASAAEIMAF